MSTYRRNILVGALVLGAILLVGWMFVSFSSKTAELFAPPQMTIHFTSTRADGLSDGSAVNYLGVNVGRVAKVRRTEDGMGVAIDALVDRNPPLPANIRAVISSNNALGGTATLNLDLNDDEKPAGQLAPDAKLKAVYLGLQLNLISPEIVTMSKEIGLTVKQLRDSGAIDDLDATIKQVRDSAAKAGALVDSLNKSAGDPKTVEDIKAAVANVRAATETATRVASKMEVLADKLSRNSDDVSDAIKSTRGHVDDLSKALGDRLVQTSAVLDNVRDITGKLDKGEGSAGQMINDPKLYQALVDSSRELSATVTDLHRLIEQWEQEGVSLKLK
jgi:phospholipid/cholesterol/gamma-HCH transport system substrate-binding protein